jgi:hypothetical protein
MIIHDMESGNTVETTPEEFMKAIQDNINEWKKLQEKFARYEEE